MRFEGVRLDQLTVSVRLENRDANPITHMRTRKHARPQGARSDRSEGQARTPKLQIPQKKAVSMRLDPPCDKRQAIQRSSDKFDK